MFKFVLISVLFAVGIFGRRVVNPPTAKQAKAIIKTLFEKFVDIIGDGARVNTEAHLRCFNAKKFDSMTNFLNIFFSKPKQNCILNWYAKLTNFFEIVGLYLLTDFASDTFNQYKTYFQLADYYINDTGDKRTQLSNALSSYLGSYAEGTPLILLKAEIEALQEKL